MNILEILLGQVPEAVFFALFLILTTTYPFVNCDCTPVYASQVRTRRVYSTRVNTAVGTGVFKYIGKCCLPSNATTVNQSIPTSAT